MTLLSILSKTDGIFFNIFLFASPISIIIVLFTLFFWSVYLFDRIKTATKLLRHARENMHRDNSVYFTDLVFYYKTEQVKFIYLFLINLAEHCGNLLYAAGFGVNGLLWKENEKFEFPSRFSTNCSLSLYNNFEIKLATEVPIGLILVSSAEVGLLLGMVFGICLMRYLEARNIHKNGNIQNQLNLFLKITFLIVLSYLILGSIPQTVILHRIIEPVVQMFYFIVWVKQARKFYKIIQSMALDYRIVYQSERSYQLAILGAYQFAIIMSLSAAGLGGLILTEMFSHAVMLVSTVLYYGPCLFNYLYSTPIYVPVLWSPIALQKFEIIILVANILSRISIVVSTTLFEGQFMLLSLGYLGNRIARCIKNISGRGVRTRYTPWIEYPQLYEHLI